MSETEPNNQKVSTLETRTGPYGLPVPNYDYENGLCVAFGAEPSATGVIGRPGVLMEAYGGDCFFTMSATPTATDGAKSFPLRDGVPKFMPVPPGAKIGFIGADDAEGSVFIYPTLVDGAP